MRKAIISLFIFAAMLSACQKNDYRMNGTSKPYEYEVQKYTPAPSGFEPFYINYVGRHGSRYLIDNSYINKVKSVLLEARQNDMLTNKGKELIIQLDLIEKGTEGKWGALTEAGKKELEGIAERMIANYKDAFSSNVYMQTDPEERCVQSMNAFSGVLSKEVQKENLSIEILNRQNALFNFFLMNKDYVDYYKNGQWVGLYEAYADSIFKNSKTIRLLFQEEFIPKIKNGTEFLHSLYKVYSNLAGTPINVNLEDLFANKTLFEMWNVDNVREYLQKGPTPINDWQSIYIAFPLLEDFLATANNAVTESDVSGDFRFAHAETIIPFAALLGIKCASAKETDLKMVSRKWLDFEVSPMAANIQWIFYTNEDGKIIVKMLLNEKEVEFPIESKIKPYYYWEDINRYYQDILDNLPVDMGLSTEQKLVSFKVK